MKRSDLDLDTIYADRDGNALMLLSLDQFAVVSRKTYVYDRRDIRTPRAGESSGVLVVRRGRHDLSTLRAYAEQLRAGDLPTRQQRTSDGEIAVIALSSIASPWEGHVAARRAEGEARHQATLRERELRQTRAKKIKRARTLIPETVTGYVSMWEHTDKVETQIDTLLEILERLHAAQK